MAAKKTFKDNPALRFISETKNPLEEESTVETTAPFSPPKKSKLAPDGFKPNPLYVETKTKRVQLVFQPSLWERVKAKANEQGLSLNEYCHRVLDAATKKE